MQFVLMKLLPPHRDQRGNGEFVINSVRDKIGGYFTNETHAHSAAKEAAEQEPGTAFVVMNISKVYEAKKPAKPAIIAKKLNDAGELVIDNG